MFFICILQNFILHCLIAHLLTSNQKKQSSNYEITSKRTRFVATYDTLAACFPREIDHLPWEVHWHYLHVKKGDVWNESQLKILQTHIGYIHTQLCINEYVYIKICVYIYIAYGTAGPLNGTTDSFLQPVTDSTNMSMLIQTRTTRLSNDNFKILLSSWHGESSINLQKSIRSYLYVYIYV